MKHRHIVLTTAVLALASISAVAQTRPAATDAEIEYLAVLIGGKKIGHATMQRDVAGGKVTTTQTMVMTIARMDTAITVTQKSVTVETTGGKPLSYENTMVMGALAQVMTGKIGADGKVTATSSVLGQTQTRTYDWPKGALMAEGLRLLSKKWGLKKATTYKARMFDPSIGAVAMTVTVGDRKTVDLLGRVVELTEMTTLMHMPTGQPVTAVSYVDDDLDALKTEMSMMGMEIELLACTRQFALSKNEDVDLLSKLVLKSPKPLANAGGAKAIAYHLKVDEGRKLEIPTTDNQTVKLGPDGTVVVTVRPVKGGQAAFPYQGEDTAALEALKPTRYLQSEDKKIVALARKAVAGATDAATAAKRLETFVTGYITAKDLSVGYATASEVAVSRQGDCTEHAVLLAAMCRAAGIPAEVIVGLGYAPVIGEHSNVFGPHAWVRVYVGGKWAGLDAALKGYDARHIALAVGDGDPKSFFGLVSALGYFKIAGVQVEK